jgi:hypothetical protein
MQKSVHSLTKRISRKIQRIWTIRSTRPAIKAYQSIEGFLSVYEAATLYRLAEQLPINSTIVEIGSWKGKSTYCLARGLRQGKVIAIDPFDTAGEPGSAEIYQNRQGNEPLFNQFRTQMKNLGVIRSKHVKVILSNLLDRFKKLIFYLLMVIIQKKGVSLTLQTMRPIYQKMAFWLFMILIRFVTNLGQLGS